MVTLIKILLIVFLCVAWLLLCHLVSEDFNEEFRLNYLVAFLLCILFTPVLMFFVDILIQVINSRI